MAVAGAIRLQVEADGHRRDLLGPAHAVAQKLGPLGRAEGDDARRPQREQPFDPPDEGATGRAEVAMKDVTVKCMHRDGNAGGPGGEPADHASLRRVRLDNIRA